MMPSGNQYVDVRDVAEVHLRILSRGFHGERYTLGGHYLSWRELAPTLEQLTGRKLLKVPTTGMLMRGLGTVIDQLKRVKTMDIPMGHEAMVYATKWVKMDSSQVERELDFSFRPISESLVDTIRWLYRAGHITSEQVGKLAP
jgi:nucleoside-diphosphate-sugar epimerase